MRVYTWNLKKSRYETAFIENDLCGALPIQVGKSAKGEPEFRFHTMDAGKEERVYRLMQTVVRRIRDDRVMLPSRSRSAPAGKKVKR
jgi:hypothetical protein